MLDRLISRLRRTSSTALNHRDNSVTGEGHRVSVRHHDEQVGRSINKIDKNDNKSTGKTRQNNHVGVTNYEVGSVGCVSKKREEK